MKIAGVEHHIDEYTGFLKQTNPKPFKYTETYNAKQSTNEAMSYLRLGVLSGHIGSWLTKCNVLELGPGNGSFFRVMQKVCASVDGYDVAESKYSTVTLEQARSKRYDLLVACDVIEHMPDINDLFKFKFDLAYISFPNMPEGDLSTWRHFKPDEHLWYFNSNNFYHWALMNACRVIYHGNPEDLIRTPWDENKPNIATFILERIA